MSAKYTGSCLGGECSVLELVVKGSGSNGQTLCFGVSESEAVNLVRVDPRRK